MTMFFSLILLMAGLSPAFAQPQGTKSNSQPTQQGSDEFAPRKAGSHTRAEASVITRIITETRDLQDESKKPETKPERKQEIARAIQTNTAQVDTIDAQNTGPAADPDLKAEAAAFAMQVRDLPTATTRADQAVSIAENHEDPVQIANALKTRALISAAAGDTRKANADAKRVLEMNPNDQQAALIEQITGNHVKAKQLDMKSSEAKPQLLEQLMTDVRKEAAKPTRPEGFGESVGYTKEAGTALKLGDWQAVYDKATLALQKLPDNPKARLERATASINLDHPEDAIADAVEGLKLKPNSPALLSVKAAAENAAGKPKQAFADASKALEINPKLAVAWLQKGLAREKLGEPDDQYLEDFKTAAELDPDLEPDYADALKRRSGGGVGHTARVDHGASANYVFGFLFGGTIVFFMGVTAFWLGIRRKKQPKAKTGSAPSGGSIVGGSFRLGPIIGSGGMGHVYEAWDTNLERPVAIKRLSDKLREEPGEAEALIREAKTVAGLKHPNIVAIYDAFMEEGEVYLVFELVKGETLYDYIKRKGGRLSKESALKLLGPMCSALDYAHERRVIHRDLKPTNVMLEDGHLKIMDFGIARRTTSENLLTMTSRVAGTPPFMAPEQQYGEVSRESDLYALAVCAYHMLAGALPFEGDGAHAMKLEGRYTPIAERVPGIPPAVDAVFAKAFAPQRAERHHSAAEFFAALRDALL